MSTCLCNTPTQFDLCLFLMYCVAGVLGVQNGLDYEIGAYAYAILSMVFLYTGVAVAPMFKLYSV